jgi:hypothetical protein
LSASRTTFDRPTVGLDIAFAVTVAGDDFALLDNANTRRMTGGLSPQAWGANCVTVQSLTSPKKGWAFHSIPVTGTPAGGTAKVVSVRLGPSPDYDADETEVLRVTILARCLVRHSRVNDIAITLELPGAAETVSSALEGSAASVGAVGASGAAVGVPTMALAAAQSEALYELGACRHARDSYPPWFAHPLRFSIGDTELRGALGAVAGNTFIIVFVTLVHVIIAEIALSIRKKKNLQNKAAPTRLGVYANLSAPLAGFIAMLILLQHTVTYSVRLMTHGTGSETAAGALTLVLWLIPVAAVAVLLTAKFFATWEPLDTDKMTKLQRFVRGDGHWIENVRGAYVEHFGVLFRYFRRPFHWAIVPELVIAIACGVAVGSRPFNTGCSSHAMALALILGVHALVLLVTRPFKSAWDNATFILIAVLLFVGAVIVAGEVGGRASMAAGVLPTVILFLCTLKVILDVVFACLLRNTKTARKAPADTSLPPAAGVLHIPDEEMRNTSNNYSPPLPARQGSAARPQDFDEFDAVGNSFGTPTRIVSVPPQSPRVDSTTYETPSRVQFVDTPPRKGEPLGAASLARSDSGIPMPAAAQPALPHVDESAGARQHWSAMAAADVDNTHEFSFEGGFGGASNLPPMPGADDGMSPYGSQRRVHHGRTDSLDDLL